MNFKHILIANYGNESLALIQWAHDNQLKDLLILSVDTGFAAENWSIRITQCEKLAESYGFATKKINSPIDFESLMLQRTNFPSQKFQWCATVLKGMAIIDYLDQIDPQCESLILMAKRREASQAYETIGEFIQEDEHFGDRKVWQPLYKTNDLDRNNLIKKTGLALLTHRSLECEPCVNNNLSDFKRLSVKDKTRLEKLENKINKKMFSKEQMEKINQLGESANPQDMFNMGCGSPWGCGL